jgi:hypothetical protein
MYCCSARPQRAVRHTHPTCPLATVHIQATVKPHGWLQMCQNDSLLGPFSLHSAISTVPLLKPRQNQFTQTLLCATLLCTAAPPIHPNPCLHPCSMLKALTHPCWISPAQGARTDTVGQQPRRLARTVHNGRQLGCSVLQLHRQAIGHAGQASAHSTFSSR